MTGQELYIKYKKKRVSIYDGISGIVVGYFHLNDPCAIISIKKGIPPNTTGNGWAPHEHNNHIVLFDGSTNIRGYWAITEDDIVSVSCFKTFGR